MTTAATMNEPDTWAWTSERRPGLDRLLETKTMVLSHHRTKNQFENRMAETGDQDARITGLAHWMLGQYGRAYSYLQKFSGDDPAVTFAKAECCLRAPVSEKGSHPQRRPDLAAKLLSGHPERKTRTEVQALLMEALFFDHNVDAAKKALADASSEFQSSADGKYAAGRIAESEGDIQAAEAEFLKALDLTTEHRPSLLRLAYLYDIRGDEASAEAMYRTLMALRPLDSHALLNYGVFLEDQGRPAEAANCYQQVLASFPTHTRATAYLKDARASLDMFFDEEIDRRTDKRSQLLRIPISDFELSVRARNCLAKMNIETLGDLVSRNEAGLLAYKNFGETSLNEIKTLLAARGLRLGMNLDEETLPLTINLPEGTLDAPAPAPVELPPGVDPNVLNRVLADLDLSVRCRKARAQMKAVPIGDLLAHPESELLSLKNFGQTSLNELKTRLAEFGVSLSI